MTVLFILFIIAFILLVLYCLYNLFFGSGSPSMKSVWVVLLILLGVSFWLMYTYFFNTDTKLVSSVHLKGSTPTIIAADTLKQPNSAVSAYGVWVYVNTWNSSAEKTVFTTKGNIDNQLSLVFHQSKPILYCDVRTGCESASTVQERITITESFPLQKWVYVIVSLSGAFVDCYIDGKLINSHKLGNTALTLSCTGNTLSIAMGTNFDAYAYNFIRYTNVMTPQQAYQTFYSTAPSSNNLGLFSGLNVNLAIVKNDGSCSTTKII